MVDEVRGGINKDGSYNLQGDFQNFFSYSKVKTLAQVVFQLTTFFNFGRTACFLEMETFSVKF